MNYLSVENLAKRFADKALFENVSFGLDQGQKTAVVGINGSGKTTLFKILMGKESADTGSFRFNKKIKVRMLEQEPQLTEHYDILAYVLSGDDELSQTVLSYERALDQNDSDKISDLIKRMDELHAWDFESQAKQILGKLGIQDLSIAVDELSGGQQKRVALAKVLIEKPDLLLLDEPTNHLDLEVIEWLEQYLAKQKMSLLLVTHDRYFLEAVTNDILELSNGTTYRYKGSYSYFLEKKLERQLNEERVIEKAKNLMRKELDWIRRMPKARGTKAKYRVDAFDELEKTAKQKIEKQELEIALSGKRLGKKIMELDKVSKGFGDKQLFENFSYTFKKADRIGIVGKNGSGKTTFLKVITGLLKPDHGELSIGETVTFGYYTQDSLEYKSESKVIDEIKNIAEFIELSDGSLISASQLLNQFNFTPEKQYDFVAKLSGGEKRRLQLLKVLMANPNFLILDEPTNDLDLVTLNTLEDYLEKFGGVLIIVSHDRYFIDRLVDHLFVLDESTTIRDFPGNFTDYRNEKTPQISTKAKNTPPPPKAKEPVANKLTYNEQREFESLESDIAKLEKEKTILNQKLLEPNDDYAVLTKLGEDLEEIKNQIAKKEDRWLELSEKV